MDCRQIDRLLEANLDGRLSGFERMALRQHLKTCRACRAKVDAMTAFSERVEKTLAGAEGPDWRRLAPPAAAATPPPGVEAGTDPAPAARIRPVPTAPARGKRNSWSPLGVALVGAAIIAVAVPFWTPPAPVTATSSWLDAAIAAEATRRAAGGRLDLVSDDPARVAAWFDARGVATLPALDLPAAVWLEGAFLTYYDGGRVAGLVLATPAGPLAVHLRPEAGSAASEATGNADAGGLQAVEAGGGAWRAAVIGAPEVVEGSGVEGWLPAALLAPAPG